MTRRSLQARIPDPHRRGRSHKANLLAAECARHFPVLFACGLNVAAAPVQQAAAK
jgi:hypothetical protein